METSTRYSRHPTGKGLLNNINHKIRVLIIDDEPDICQLLEDVITMWGMAAESALDGPQALELIKNHPFEIILADVHLPLISGLDLIPKITRHSPNAKIIVITGRADKETAIQALRSGAFDFLEKPFELELISHALQRAAEVHEAEQRQRRLFEELQKSQGELMDHKEKLEHLSRQLIETNKALTIFAQNIDREREEVQKRVVLKLRLVVVPSIEKLKRDANVARYGVELDGIIRQMIQELTDDLSADGRIASVLSFTELRVATLIRNDLTTEEIAEQLHISASTVRTHRKNIRKKLKLNNAQYSLKNFLLSKSKNMSSAT